MSISHLFAKPHDPVDLPPVDEFEASFSLRVQGAESEDALREIGTIVRTYLEQGLLPEARANKLWDSMRDRSHVLQSVYALANTVRKQLLAHQSDILQEEWAGVTSPSHAGRPVRREGIPNQCHAHIDELTAAMKIHAIEQVKIGATKLRIQEGDDWQFIPHVIEREY